MHFYNFIQIGVVACKMLTYLVSKLKVVVLILR